jgi:hypothetical protein
MIEPGPAPGSRFVTSTAIATELPFVRLLFVVAVYATCGGLTESLATKVTARAIDSGMCVTQREVGPVVIKLLTTQLHDVRVTTMVLRVATTAFGGRDAGQVSVKPMSAADVGCDLLVTIETEACLALTIAAIVAP